MYSMSHSQANCILKKVFAIVSGHTVLFFFRCPQDDKSPATNRLPLLTSGSSSDNRQGRRGGGGWGSRSGRCADGDEGRDGRSGEGEVVRGRRGRRKRTISPIQWEPAGSQPTEREHYREPRRRDDGANQEEPARKRGVLVFILCAGALGFVSACFSQGGGEQNSLLLASLSNSTSCNNLPLS